MLKFYCMFSVTVQQKPIYPCVPTPCGSNTICREQNGVAACSCIEGYIGDPYLGCRPECILNTDCPWDKACWNNKCKDPCNGACGQNAECSVAHHSPYCICKVGFTGNPLVFCNKIVHAPSKIFSIFAKCSLLLLHVERFHVILLSSILLHKLYIS